MMARSRQLRKKNYQLNSTLMDWVLKIKKDATPLFEIYFRATAKYTKKIRSDMNVERVRLF